MWSLCVHTFLFLPAAVLAVEELEMAVSADFASFSFLALAEEAAPPCRPLISLIIDLQHDATSKICSDYLL